MLLKNVYIYIVIKVGIFKKNSAKKIMQKKIIIAFIIIGVAGSIGFVTRVHGESANAVGGGIVAEMQKNILKPLKGITEMDPASIKCLSNAIDARDTALGAALQTFDQAMVSAYRNRNTQLKAALALPSPSARAEGLKAATKAFRATAHSTRLQWKKDREAAWQAFANARKECRASLAASQATGKYDDDVNPNQ